MSEAKAVHSPIGASSMHRWSVCPGSIRLSKGVPNFSSPYAEEGTRAHEAAAFWLQKGYCPRDIDEEMEAAIEVYVNAVTDSWKFARDPRDKFLIEKSFDLSSLHPGLYGTADAVLYFSKERLLQVWDYKHGQGIPVDVQEGGKGNVQLLYYALGALLETKFPCEWVEIVIVQPRCPHPDGPIRRFKIMTVDLLDFAADLIDYAKKTEAPDAPVVPGEHCQFCPAGRANACPALYEKALALAKEEFSPLMSYDPAKLSQVLEWLPTLEAWCKGVREFAYGEALHGRCPPEWKLVQKRATRKWNDEDRTYKELIAKTELTGDDVFQPAKLKSVAQIEKLLPKEKRGLLAELSSAESSGCTLVPASDPRPAVRADAAAEFKVIEAPTSGGGVTDIFS